MVRLSCQETLDLFMSGAELSQFRILSRRILDGYQRRIRMRENRRTLPPWDTPSGYLQRETYRLVRLLDDHGLSSAITQTVALNGRVPRSPTYEDNKFHWGLLAIEGARNFLTPQQRRLYAGQMLYAARHGVPEVHLIGFIYQLGSEVSIFDRLNRPEVARLFRNADHDFG